MSKPFNPDTSIPALTNKVIFVTGGNAGIGKEAITQLAKHSPSKIYLGARSADKAAAAIKDIKAAVPDTPIEHVPLDLSSLKSVQAAAATIISKTDRLDILLNNAGIMAVPIGKTEDGFEIQMGTNHLGHFYLTQKLLPLLTKTASAGNDVRVVSLSSTANDIAHWTVSFDKFISTEKQMAMGPWNRYGASKAANVLFAAELARRHPEILSVSLQPGFVKTDLHVNNSSSGLMGKMIGAVTHFQGVDVPEGTKNSLYLATAPKAQLKSGKFYLPVGKETDNAYAKNVEQGRKMWEWSEAEVKKAGF
jgi:NAD(P)-dependent dehydrogenase (short-subunit alcohol dehydrogenase family)